MIETIFGGVLPLILLYSFAFLANITVHELGHAFPVLLKTNQDVRIYIGSLGDPYKCLNVTFGRLTFYCKKNPLTWYKGCCVFSDYGFPINQRILFVAGGPIASFILTAASWLLLSVFENTGFPRVVTGGVFLISILYTLGILIPFQKVRYSPSGIPVYNDLFQIVRLMRSKY